MFRTTFPNTTGLSFIKVSSCKLVEKATATSTETVEDKCNNVLNGPFTPSVSKDAARLLPNQFYCFGVVQLHIAEVSASMLDVTVQLRIHGFDLGAISQRHHRCVAVTRCKRAFS